MFCSTIIPTIGRPTLSQAVCSVLDQRFTADDFEVIVVNDSGQPLRETDWQKSERVRLIHTNRCERSVARNTGAAIAKGRYLHFLDDDDWLLPGALENFWVLSKNSDAAWLYGSSQLVDRKEEPIIQLHHGMNGNCFIQVLAREWIPLQASLIDTETFFAIGGFNPLVTVTEDIDLCRRIALRGDMVGTSATVACIRMGEEGSSTNHFRAAEYGRWAREKVLSEPGVFARMRTSARSSYWHGRIIRAYLTSAVWNLLYKRIFTAASRIIFCLVGFVLAGHYIFSRDFWGAVTKHYESETFLRGFWDADRPVEELSTKPILRYAIQHFDETGPMRAPYLVCKGFIAAGWDVDIITAASLQNTNINFVWDHIPILRVKGFSKKIRQLKLAAELLKKREGEVVITWVWYWYCFSLVVSKLLFGSPYVVVLDTYTHRNAQGVLGRLRQEIRYGLVLRNANIILAEVPKSFEYAKKYLKRPEVLLVPSCLWHKDLKEFELYWKKGNCRLQREPVVFYAGRLIERKNVQDLIEAFICLSDRFPEWKLEIRGPIASSAYYASLLDLVGSNGLSDRICFWPSLSGERLYRRYRETSIYALPSRGEGFPTTIIEAMYFGGAIVAGASGGVGYQLNNGACGLLHEPGDVDSLTAHLETLMASEEERNRLMSKARKRMIELFTWENYFPMLDHKFRDLI